MRNNSDIRSDQNTQSLPERRSVLGVPVSVTDYSRAVAAIMDAAGRRPLLVSALAVHGVIEAIRDAEMSRAIETFDIVTPDGQPVRHMLNLLYRVELNDRVYGPDLMLKLAARAAEQGVPIYLYGSTQHTVDLLAASLVRQFPNLKVVGAEPSLFRPLTEQESSELAGRVAESGAGLMFIGLGCPRQEKFAFEHRSHIHIPQICVGAAFDFHAGTKKQAPPWMQKHALEWLFRLGQEPRRLFGRYLRTNSEFVIRAMVQILRQKTRKEVAR